MLIQIYAAESLLLRVQKIFEKGEKSDQVLYRYPVKVF